MKKGLIVLWFGKFPNYFDLYLKSCSSNPTWNWMIYTDQDTSSFDVPSNVEFIYTGFKQMIGLIEDRIDIHLNKKIKPYKLCDFRPLYGYIFLPELKRGGYEYWGHCDIDVIWGNLSKFYPDELIKQYDRFLCWGHLTLYKNTVENNLFFKKAEFGDVDWRVVLRSKYNWGFDEYRKFALLRIQEKADGYTIFKKRTAVGDISPWDGYNYIEGEEHGVPSVMRALQYVHVKNGLVYLSIKAESCEIEKAYVHFQKRDFDIARPINPNNYYVLSNTICNNKQLEGKQVIKKDKRALSIKITQLLKVLEIIKVKYVMRSR